MEPQVDYEAELTLAAFRSPEQADAAFRRLEALGISSTEITRVPLGPGHYQTEDITFEEENAGVRQGTVIGAPIGAAVGLGMAIVVPEARGAVLAGMAAIAFLDPSVCDLAGLFSVPPPSLGLATGQS